MALAVDVGIDNPIRTLPCNDPAVTPAVAACRKFVRDNFPVLHTMHSVDSWASRKSPAPFVCFGVASD
jgi:hypothetical protein